MKLYNVLSVLGVLMIIVGLGVQSMQLYEIVNKQKELIDKQANEIIKLRAENESLWDNYYMNISNYEDYEYYE